MASIPKSLPEERLRVALRDALKVHTQGLADTRLFSLCDVLWPHGGAGLARLGTDMAIRVVARCSANNHDYE